MNNISDLVNHYLQRYNCHVSEEYIAVLREACEIHPPPHGQAWYGNMYRQYARKPEWFANSLIINAVEEGNGSKQVWEFWQRVGNQDFAKRIHDHSIDESRHSKMFATLVNILFPMSVDEELKTKLKSFSPEYIPEKHPLTTLVSAKEVMDESVVMDELIQINLLEIRALILQLLLRPVLQAYAKPEDVAKVTRMSDQFIFDETKHIEYSAYCMGEYIKSGHFDWLREKTIHRQLSVNEMFPVSVDNDDTMGTTILKVGTTPPQ